MPVIGNVGPQQTLTVKEADGSPSVSGVTTLKVSNGTLTDDGSGVVSVTTGGGGGGISGLTTGQYVTAASSTTIQTDGIKRYVALLTQSGTSAPTATVLQNTLGGTVVWTRAGTGLYDGTLTGVFTANKTTPCDALINVVSTNQMTGARNTDNVYRVRTGDGGALADDLLNGTLVSFRVYP